MSWVANAGDESAQARILADRDAVLERLPLLLRKNLARPENVATWFTYRGNILGGDKARASWRVLFAEAILEWEREQEKNA